MKSSTWLAGHFLLLVACGCRTTLESPPTPEQVRAALAADPELFLRSARATWRWDEAAEPAHVLGPIHFVGTRGLSAWLITGSAGHVLLNTGMPGSGPLIEASVRQLGFDPADIRVLLAGHAHVDHVGALAYLARRTGARVAMSESEVELLASGGRGDFHYGASPSFAYEPWRAERVLNDGDTVELGELRLTAHLTPGHTRGAISWEMDVQEDGRTYRVVFPDGTALNPGYRLRHEPSYAGIEANYRRTFDVLGALRPDVWLHAHTDTIDYEARRERSRRDGVRAWLDPDGYVRWLDGERRRFDEILQAEERLAAPKTVITFDAKDVRGDVSPFVFGANHRWVSDACGSADPVTGITYPSVATQMRDIGISMIRYPAGLLGNLFQWERAIGPQEKRGQQVSGLVLTPVPFDSKFGPDEYGALLDATGAAGNLLINCGTASAADAANFVAYMTSPAGSPPVNGVDWAARRAANGHAAPYPVAYVEIGNEYEPFIQAMVDQNYWIKGEAVGFSASNNAEKIARLYAFGGSTRFAHQPVVAKADWREATSVSTGEPGQEFFVRYAPVTAGSETVFVDGTPAKSCVVDHESGAVTFADGAQPPKGAKITVSYVSGPHDGFVDFYSAIKAVNPSVKVCASIHDESFIRLMGDQHPYDGIQQHPYVMGNPKKDVAPDVEDLFVQMASRTVALENQVQHTRDLIAKHAGSRAEEIELILSEYGQLGTFPAFARHFARSQAQAVLNALCLRAWIQNGVQAADRTCLTDYTFAPIPPELAAVQSMDAEAAKAAAANPENSTSGDFALIGGPGPDSVVTPTGLAHKLVHDNVGTKLIASAVSGSPELKATNGATVDALLAFATLDDNGSTYLVVVNTDPVNDLTATIAPLNFTSGGRAVLTTLASPRLEDENNPTMPTNVALRTSTVAVPPGSFELAFPRHSVTAVKLGR